MSSASAPAAAPAPQAVHRAGDTGALAEYPSTDDVLAAAAALRALAPANLLDLVPAERTLLLVGAAPADARSLAALLDDLPAAPEDQASARQRTLAVTYDGEDLEELAAALEMSRDALVAAHSGATWVAAFGGFAPGFAYLLPEREPPLPEIPRRAEPRTAVPPGSVALAARYCGVYPRSSPGGWQLIGRTEEQLFDPERREPALLTPGTRVRFVPQRPRVRRAAQATAAAAGSLLRRPARAPGTAASLEVLAAGPRTLIEDAGRLGRGAMGVSSSGAFDRGAMTRANLALGNRSHAPVLECLLGPLRLRALRPALVAVAGADAPVQVHRAVAEDAELGLEPGSAQELPIALDAGDEIEVGPVVRGLRIVLAVRGGLEAPRTLDSASTDTLSGLGPAALADGDVLRTGSRAGAVAAGRDGATRAPEVERSETTTIPLRLGPRDELLGAEASAQLLESTWTVRPDSDRVGVRLQGQPLPAPEGTLPSEPMVPGAIQVPPSGLPVVFGPDHPTTGGYPVIGVLTREGLDRIAQAAPGDQLRFATV